MDSVARVVALSFLATLVAGTGRAHDIPNARIDRSIQVEIRPGRLIVDYELSLSELTLTQDLKALIGPLPGGDRRDWFARYGEVTGPLNARGVIVMIDGEPVDLTSRGFGLVVDDHPRYSFHLDAPIPERGRLRLVDSNYAASEGNSRLAVRGYGGIEVVGDSLPPDVERIAVRPAWELSPEEESRTKRILVDYRPGPSKAVPSLPIREAPPPSVDRRAGLSTLLDRAGASSWAVLSVLAFFLGIAHSIQPGHGKSLVVAASLGASGGSWRGVATGLAATVGHLASVLALAGVLWATGANRYGQLNSLILHATGFLLAVVGVWKIGHFLGDRGAGSGEATVRGGLSTRSYLGLGLASGAVPCWDAVALLMVASALGRLGLGLVLLLGFSLGMAVVLAGTGWLASVVQLKIGSGRRCQRSLGILGGSLLAIIGALFLTS